MSATRLLSESESTYIRQVEAVVAVIRELGYEIRDSRKIAADIIRKLDEVS